MSKAKMTFPEVPGKTPKEQFLNLARHLIMLPKAAMADVPHRSKRKHRKTAKGAASKLILLVLLASVLGVRAARAEDIEHAALRLAHAAGDAANASEKTKDAALRHPFVMGKYVEDDQETQT